MVSKAYRNISVRRKTRFISSLLLVVLSVLILKNLAPNLMGSQTHDCNEFAHLHFHTLSIDSEHDHEEESCHEGKSVFAFSIFPVSIQVPQPIYTAVFKNIFELKNNFKSPYLEPLRRPPKIA